ncbi:MAGE protein, partial [Thelephora ganbajun]
KARDLVRLALFTENRRAPLKREEISKKVLGNTPRAFKDVLERAQGILRTTFGMELVELQSRAELDKEDSSKDNADGDRRKATGVKKKGKHDPPASLFAASGSKSYILRSILDPIILDFAALTDQEIYEQEIEDLPEGADDATLVTYGSIISWSDSDQLGSLGILYVVLALVLVSGRVIADSTHIDHELRAIFKQLHLQPTESVYFDDKSTHQSLTVNTYLGQLARQGYLDYSKIGDVKSGGKRSRIPNVSQAGGEEGSSGEWRWGPRAHGEVGEQGVARFVAEFMAERAAEPEAGEETQQKLLEAMLKGIKGVTGELSDVK